MLENKLSTERLARKNEVHRVEKELSKDWVGDEMERVEKEEIIKTIESGLLDNAIDKRVNYNGER